MYSMEEVRRPGTLSRVSQQGLAKCTIENLEANRKLLNQPAYKPYKHLDII